MFHRRESFTLPAWLPFPFISSYLLLGLGNYGLLDNNEGLYAEIAREMAQGSSLVIPHVLGVPYMEKPPLLYYLTAASFRLFGENEIAARLVPLSASLLTLWSVSWFCTRLGLRQTGRLAVIMLASGLGYMLMSRLVMFDMLFTAFFTLALFSFFIAWRENSHNLLRVSLSCLALALLTKGFLALALFGLVLGSYFLYSEPRRIGEALRFLADIRAWGLFLLLALPWHLAASLEHPRFAWFYFINEHVLRFLGKRIPHDYYGGPVYYYLPRLLLFLFPWTAYLTLALFRGSGRQEGEQQAAHFLWAAWLLPLLFFSISSAKANYYLIVAIPPLVILLARQVEALLAAGREKLLALPLALTLLPAAAAILFLLRQPGGVAGARFQWYLPAVIGFLCLTLLGLVLALRRRPVGALLASALLLLPLQVSLLHAIQEQAPMASAKLLAQAITQQCPDCDILIYRDFERLSSLPFYLNKHPVIIDSENNELWFATKELSRSPIFSSSNTLAQQHDTPPLAIIVHKIRLPEFTATSLATQCQPMLEQERLTVYLRPGKAQL